MLRERDGQRGPEAHLGQTHEMLAKPSQIRVKHEANETFGSERLGLQNLHGPR